MYIAHIDLLPVQNGDILTCLTCLTCLFAVSKVLALFGNIILLQQFN